MRATPARSRYDSDTATADKGVLFRNGRRVEKKNNLRVVDGIARRRLAANGLYIGGTGGSKRNAGADASTPLLGAGASSAGGKGDTNFFGMVQDVQLWSRQGQAVKLNPSTGMENAIDGERFNLVSSRAKASTLSSAFHARNNDGDGQTPREGVENNGGLEFITNLDGNAGEFEDAKNKLIQLARKRS